MTKQPCPVCGRARKWYVRESTRGTTSVTHKAGEKRTRRELRATCGRKLCQQIQRGRTLLAGHGGP
jgi:hypothetical protein